MRVLHVGNIANNAYLNAKLLRRVGIEADALCPEWHIFCQPEWEDAALEGTYAPQEDLAPAAASAGWTRPEWALGYAGWDPDFKSEPWLRERLLVLWDLPGRALTTRRLRPVYKPLRPVLGADLSVLDVARVGAWKRRLDKHLGTLDELFASYDVVQLYGVHPALLPLLQADVPYVAFEHGTMREMPFEPNWRGRMLSLGYRLSDRVIITNPDVIERARLLGVAGKSAFIPHPLDESKYAPGPSTLRAEVERSGFDFLLLCPSRHDWHVKGTDRLLRAFAEFVRSVRPRALLLFFDWGQEVERSRELARELGVTENVRWSEPLPKLRLIDAYRAADIVLDQFLIGTFGAVAPEAMACECPVIMAFDRELHSWCFPVLPPIVDARTPDEIYAELTRLAGDEAARVALGKAGRAWVEEHHGWRVAVNRQIAIYEELVNVQRRDAVVAAGSG